MSFIIDNRDKSKLREKSSVTYESKIKSKIIFSNVVKKIKFFTNSKTKIFWFLFLIFNKLRSIPVLGAMLAFLIAYYLYLDKYYAWDFVKEVLYSFSVILLSIYILTVFFYGLSEVTQKKI